MANGGVIGPVNTVSVQYDKDKVTSFTSSGCFNKATTNPAAPGNATVVVVSGAGGSGPSQDSGRAAKGAKDQQASSCAGRQPNHNFRSDSC